MLMNAMPKPILGVLFTLIMMAASPIASAYASDADYPDVKSAKVQTNDDEISEAILKTHGHIPEDGEGGAFGYAVITDEGFDSVIVTTTHEGVYDSEEQRDENDPVFHNHYITLREGIDECGDDPAVGSISFESPGDVSIQNKKAVLGDLPAEAELQTVIPALDKDDAELDELNEFNPGTNVESVVSFQLEPVVKDGDIQAVCVTDIWPTANLEVN
jgi:hypothetical protein